MSLDLFDDQEAILDKLRMINGGRFYDELLDEADLARAPMDSGEGEILPYGVVAFGEAYPTGGDRSLLDDGAQPHIMPIFIDLYAEKSWKVRKLSGAVRTLLVPPEGWAPSPNCSSVRLFGGGQFRRRESAGRPTRFLRTISGELTVNLQVELPA